MRATNTTGLRLMFFAAVIACSDAAAQTPAHPFLDLQSRLKVGQGVWVLDDKGVTTTGRVVSISGTQVEVEGTQAPKSLVKKIFFVEGNAPRKRYLFTETSLRRIQTPDSTWDGAVIGVVIGGLMGFAACADPQSRDETCPLPAVGLAVLGGYLGDFFDGLIHHSVYDSRQKPRVSVVPSLVPHGFAVAGTIRF